MKTRGFSIIRMPIEGVVEPVTLEKYKLHAEINFEAHDDLLNSLLAAARNQVEKFLCVSLVKSNITVRWEELTTQELPYGPVLSIISVKDSVGEDITDYTTEGLIGDFIKIKANRSSPTIIRFVAGVDDYTDINEDIQLAIIKLATDNFEQRTGIDLSGKSGIQRLPNDWKNTCKSYRRLSWMA